MTKQVHVSENAHKNLAKLKGYLLESSVEDVVDRILIHAGYGPEFFSRLETIMKERNEKKVV